MPADPFTLTAATTSPLSRAALAAARPCLSWLLGSETFGELYRRMPAHASETFCDVALRALDIEACCAPGDLSHIPRDGGLVVAANHPHGALDGLVMASVVGRVRGDVRLLANHWLSRIPELQDVCFFVDPFEGPAAAARSQTGLRAAHLWLRRGGALVVFPSGEVAHERGVSGMPVDRAWRNTIGRLALQTGARVQAAHIAGANSRTFYLAGRIHPALRTALLARELLKKRGARVTVRLGEARHGTELGVSPTAASVTATVQRAVAALARPPIRSDLTTTIASEITGLPREACLVSNGPFDVYCADSSDIPVTLREIGRLRAIAYRAAGEGTATDLDLDRFDDHYLHLFSWDRDAQMVVGAYRIGRTDRIAAGRGVDGLYTRTLFRYDEAFINRLSPALELGRSFVRPEYQRHHSALLVLWKGIGAFVAKHPEYRVLFGPVSISTRYSDASHALLAAFLEQNHLDSSLAALVEPRHPRPQKPRSPGHGIVPDSIDAANRLVSALEADGKGMPVLLRHYLKLNARLIGFNIDPGFGDVLDALMMVDLERVDPAILTRYLGRENAARFLALHSPAAA